MSAPLLKPEGNLQSHYLFLWFASATDEAAYLKEAAARRLPFTRIVAAVLAVLGILSVVVPGDDLGDTLTLVVLLVCRLVPLVAVAIAAVMGAPLHWLWPAGAAAAGAATIVSGGAAASLCSARDDGATSTSCGPVEDGFAPFMAYALMWSVPLIMTSGLGVRWAEAAVGTLVGGIVSLALLLSVSASDHLLQPLLTSVAALAVSLVSAYTSEAAQRVAFKASIAADRRLESLVEETVSTMVHNESQQRLNELVKLVPALVSELDPQGVVQFVSPACRALLGVAPTDMLAADSLQFVHPGDQRKAKNALKRALAAAQATDGSAGMPNARQAYSRAMVRRRRSNPDGTASWINMEMHVFVVDRPGRDPALLTIERLATFAEVAAAEASDRGEDGVHSTAPQEGAVGTSTFDPQHERNLGFALAYATLVDRLLPGVEDPPSTPMYVERVQTSAGMLEDALTSLTSAARCKSHTLPMTNVGAVNILRTVDVCVSLAKSLAGGVLLEVHSDSSVPATVSCDGPKARAALMALLVGAFSRSGPNKLGGVAVVLVRSVVPQPGAPPSIIRLELQVKGVEGSKASITSRQLAADLQLDPLSDALAPPERVDADTSQNESLLPLTKLHRYTLATCRHLALSMGGDMGVAPGAPALSDVVGVTFWLHIPVTSQPKPFVAGSTAVPMSMLRQRVLSSPMPRLSKDPFAPHNVPVRLTGVPGGTGMSAAPTPAGGAIAPAPAAAPVPAPAPTPAPGRGVPPKLQNLGKHIMFVDDEDVNRRLGSRMLRRLGCTMELLEDGDQVQSALAATDKPFDMIIIDIVMQRSDGAEVCSLLRDAGNDLPIIAMTGNTGARDVKRFLAAGFDMMLAKPFDIMGLGRAILEAPVRRARTKARNGGAGAAVAAAAAAGVEMSSAQ